MNGPVLAAVDFSDVGHGVVAMAGRLAKAMGRELYLIHVAAAEPEFVGYDPGPQHVRDFAAQRYREEHKKLQHMAERLRAEGLVVTPLLVQGAVIDKVVAEAQKLGASHLVMGRHGHGRLAEVLLGSTSQGVLRAVPCPVTFVPA